MVNCVDQSCGGAADPIAEGERWKLYRCRYCGLEFWVPAFDPMQVDSLSDGLDALEDVANRDGLASWQDVEGFFAEAAFELEFNLEVGP